MILGLVSVDGNDRIFLAIFSTHARGTLAWLVDGIIDTVDDCTDLLVDS